MAKLKRLILVVTIMVLALTTYVIVVNINAVNMTNRQKITKAFYPAIMWFTNMVGAQKATASNIDIKPNTSIYNLTMVANDGIPFNFNNLTGKKILIVNTASDCGYTGQLDELEKLYQQYKNQVEIIAFPANDFKQQEKGTNKDIAAFCKKNYGVTFPIMSKSVVINTAAQNDIFKWLCTPAKMVGTVKCLHGIFANTLLTNKGSLPIFLNRPYHHYHPR